MKWSSLCLVLALVGCGDPTANSVLDGMPRGEIDLLAPPTVMSAPNIYLISVALAARDVTATCPTRREEGDLVVLEGGCTDEDGDTWFGQASFPSALVAEAPVGRITYQGFGVDDLSDCPTRFTERETTLIDGTVDLGGDPATGVSFDVDLIIRTEGVLPDCTDGVLRGAIVYSGTWSELDTTQTWNGTGRYGVDGLGAFTVETIDEVLDDSVCDSEALSGTTRVSGRQEAIFAYDGATDCSPDSTITWTLDGVDQGELTGVSCAATPGPAEGSPFVILAFGTLALVWRRRRSRP